MSIRERTPKRSTLALPWRVLLLVLVGVLVVGVVPAVAELRVERFAFSARNRDGSVDVQAGSHPFALTSTILFNEPGPVNGDLKDARVELPPGFVGDPDATPRCGFQVFIREEERKRLCPNDTAIGIATAYIKKVGVEGVSATSNPVYNLVPQAGVAAEFGFVVAGKTPVLLDASVRTGSDYGLTESTLNVNQAVVVAAAKVTIWGEPAEVSHDKWRGTCVAQLLAGPQPPEEVGEGLREGEDELEGPLWGPGEEPGTGLPESVGECASGAPLLALLTNPVSCGHPRVASVAVDSWQEPGVYRSKSVVMPEVVGCGRVGFGATLGVTPETTVASSTTGVGVGVHVPQEATENPAGLAEGDVRDTTVTLPAGLELNGSSLDGLEGCSTSQVGFTGFRELEPVVEPGVQTAQFTAGEAACPDASKLGVVRVKTPLLEGELTGGMFLASPQNFAGLPENPFSSLLAVYILVSEPKTGVVVKLAGHVEVGGQPGVVGLAQGQLRTTVENTPEFPFSDLEVELFGGERSSFATPAQCGAYQSQALFTPWSTPAGTGASSVFQVTSGPAGKPCGSPLPFNPSVAAGGTSLNAGQFTGVSTTVSRGDGDQGVRAVSLVFPLGFTGVPAGVPLCGETQANAGTCSEASKVGETSASVGVGGGSYTVGGGRIYLTGPYQGAPYGLSFVVPPDAGPFVLQEGRPIVVRARLEIDPVTAAVKVTTDGSGAFAIPQFVEGLPVQIKRLYAVINRAGFTVDPSSCEPTKITGSVLGAEGTTSSVSVPFQVANCGALRFEPKVSVTASGHASKKEGEAVAFKVSYPTGALGTEAWVKSVKLTIPKQLPSELKAIQQACPAETFEANPASCPPHAQIGTATVHTQLLSEPLTGPVYFVSYGNAKFPDVVMLLSGDNVHIRLTGETNIHEGITSVTLPATPQVPFETVEVTVPAGEYSEFGTNLGLGNYDFCGQKLTMPTELDAANGLQVRQETPITITGCPSTFSIRSRHIHGHTLTLTVYVPGAGRLTVKGRGISTHTRTASTQELLTLTLNAARHGRSTLHLTYTPTHGTPQTVRTPFKH